MPCRPLVKASDNIFRCGPPHFVGWHGVHTGCGRADSFRGDHLERQSHGRRKPSVRGRDEKNPFEAMSERLTGRQSCWALTRTFTRSCVCRRASSVIFPCGWTPGTYRSLRLPSFRTILRAALRRAASATRGWSLDEVKALSAGYVEVCVVTPRRGAKGGSFAIRVRCRRRTRTNERRYTSN